MLGVEPFGAAVADYQEGIRQHPCVIERDDGFRSLEDLEPYFSEAAQWSPQERTALARVGPRVLDIGCGPGRHLLELQKETFTVGLDISWEVLRVCRQRGGKLLVVGCANRLPFRSGVFDSVLAMSNGLGISGGMPATMGMLRDIWRVLDREGHLISHTMDPANADLGIHEGYRLRNSASGRPPGLLRMRILYRDLVGPWFELLVMEPSEVTSILEEASFRLVQSIDWEGSAIYIARRAI